jgi:hypothetical protein
MAVDDLGAWPTLVRARVHWTYSSESRLPKSICISDERGTVFVSYFFVEY